RRLIRSRSPASRRRTEPHGAAAGSWSKSLISPVEEGALMLVQSLDNVREPFERMASPREAVDRLARLYDEATDALRGAVERFLKEGEPPSPATRALFRYPELRMIYAPTSPALSSPRAFAKFSEPGVYATTVTQPAEFRGYLLEQLEPLVA